MLLDLRMGMRASENAADQLSGHVEVGTVAGASRDLVDAIGSNGTRVPTDLNFWAA